MAKDIHAQALGSKGGQARAAKLSKAALGIIGRSGAAARWRDHVKAIKSGRKPAVSLSFQKSSS